MNVQQGVTYFADRVSRLGAWTDQDTEKLCEAMSARQQRVHRLWTAKDDRELVRLVRKGRNAVEIAAIVKRTPGAVRFRKSLLRARDVVSGSE